MGNTRKLREKIGAPLLDKRCKLLVVIGKIKEGSRCAVFLPLKQHRRVGTEKKQRGYRPVLPRRSQLVQPRAGSGIRELIVILNVGHKRGRSEVQRDGASMIALPDVVLPLIEKSPFDR